MATFNNAIGTDVSKATLDVHDYLHGISLQITNSKTGYVQLIKWLKKHHANLTEVVICFEHTGLYSLPLAAFLSAQKISFCTVSGLEIKRSLGLARGKSDVKDAKAIARYAYLRREELKLYQMPSGQLIELRNLLSLREKMVRDRNGYQQTLREMKAMLKVSKNDLLYRAQAHLIQELTCQIKKVEKEIKTIIHRDEQLAKLYALITSVKGVGLILGVNFLVYTGGFTYLMIGASLLATQGSLPLSISPAVASRVKRRSVI